jgi:hypothetical protein
MTWLDDLLGCNIYEGGTFVKLRRNLNFIGVDAADNLTTEAVDIYIAGARDWKESVRLATAAPLPAYVFNGAANTITAAGVGAMPNVDGVAPAVDDRLLLIGAGTTSDVHNGLWVVTSLGGVASNWSLERATLSDESSEVTAGLHVYVEEGTAYGTHRFVCTNTGAIVLNTTPIVLVTMGSTMALVTATTQGTVNSFAAGAANAVFQSDGATAGGTWVNDLSLGATPGAAFRINLTQTEWIGWNGVHGIMIDGGSDMHIGDNTTTDDINLDATTTIVHEIGGTPVLTTRTGEVESVQPVWVNIAGAYLRMGLVAGSGAGSAASVGAARLQDDAQIVFRNAADGGDVAGLSLDGTDILWLGGLYPTRPTGIDIDGNTVRLRHQGNQRLQVGTLLTTFVDVRIGGDLRYDDDEVTPRLYHEADATAGVTGDDLEAAAQDVSDPAGAAVSGDFGIRGGQGLVHANNLDGNIWLHDAPAAWNIMEKGMFVGDCVTAPNANPVAGGYLYSNAGAGTWRGSGGTITAFGPAGPRCSACGYDFWKQVCVSERFAAYMLECGWCGATYKKGPADVLGDLDARELDELVYDDSDALDPRPPHKKRDVISSIAGPAQRRKDARPTLQEYRRRGLLLIDEAELVMAGKAIDQAATRASTASALAAMRSDWATPIQSWRDLYATHEDGAALTAALDADIATADAEADTALAAKQWELPS